MEKQDDRFLLYMALVMVGGMAVGFLLAELLAWVGVL